MLRSILIFVFAALSLAAQSPESVLLQTLLAEVRQLRQEVQALAATQRGEVLFRRIQMQNEAVKSAAKKLEELKAKSANATKWRSQYEHQIRQSEDNMREIQVAAPAAQEVIRRFQTEMANLQREESGSKDAEVQALRELETERAKMDDLMKRLERIETETAQTPQARQR